VGTVPVRAIRAIRGYVVFSSHSHTRENRGRLVRRNDFELSMDKLKTRFQCFQGVGLECRNGTRSETHALQTNRCSVPEFPCHWRSFGSVQGRPSPFATVDFFVDSSVAAGGIL
jgi:hypothetical protein